MPVQINAPLVVMHTYKSSVNGHTSWCLVHTSIQTTLLCITSAQRGVYLPRLDSLLECSSFYWNDGLVKAKKHDFLQFKNLQYV